MQGDELAGNSTNGSPCQARYWTELVDLRVHASYISQHLRRVEWWDRTINIFLAVTGSGGVAAWAVRNEYPRLWSAIVAGFQLLNAANSFLPYKRRLKSLVKLNTELNELCIHAENKWYDVSEGKVRNEEIHKMYIDIKNRIHKSVEGAFAGSTLPENENFLSRARNETQSYIQARYGD